MRLVCCAVVFSFLAAAAEADETVLLASRRGGWIEAFHLNNFETAARIRVKGALEEVETSVGGDWMFLRIPHPQAADVCCGLFALNTQKLRMVAILWPALRPAIVGAKVFIQRGDSGVEVFDARSLVHLPTLVTLGTGVYQLAPSPDGRWLFGASQFPTPGLDIFDVARGLMTRHIPVEDAAIVRGAWVGSQYYLVAMDNPGSARIWAVDSQDRGLGKSRTISFGGAAPCQPPDYYEAAAVGDRLAIYPEFGMKGDPRDACAGPGGYFVADPATGEASRRMAPGLHLASLTAGSDGKSLYGLDVADPQWRDVRLVKLDVSSGEILARKTLPADVWHLTLGNIPAGWEGRLDLEAVGP